MKAKLTLSCGTGELQQVILLAIQFWLCAGVRVDAHPSGRCRINLGQEFTLQCGAQVR